ncbi:hypothetical protein ACSBR2_042165 [Camellia fascicularis]
MPSTFFSNCNYFDSLIVVRISVYTAIACEAISWVLIYRTTSSTSPSNLPLTKLQRSSRPCRLTLTLPRSASRSPRPRRSITSSPASRTSRDLSLFKFKSSVVIALVLFVVFSLLNSLFEGKAIAKLPLVPARIVQNMSHKGLQGDDPTDCSMAFLYFLYSISIQTNLQKFLGFSPPRGATRARRFPIPNPKSN